MFPACSTKCNIECSSSHSISSVKKEHTTGPWASVHKESHHSQVQEGLKQALTLNHVLRPEKTNQAAHSVVYLMRHLLLAIRVLVFNWELIDMMLQCITKHFNKEHFQGVGNAKALWKAEHCVIGTTSFLAILFFFSFLSTSLQDYIYRRWKLTESNILLSPRAMRR